MILVPPAAGIMKSLVVELKTWPVGPDGGPIPAVGLVTVRPTFTGEAMGL